MSNIQDNSSVLEVKLKVTDFDKMREQMTSMQQQIAALRQEVSQANAEKEQAKVEFFEIEKKTTT